jgi:hypothetical protein
MTMKNHRTYRQQRTQPGQQLAPHGKRIVTTALLVSTLVLPWHAAEAEPAISAESTGNNVSDPAMPVPGERMALNTVSPVNDGAPRIRTSPGMATRTEAVRLFDPASIQGLLTNPDAVTFMHQHAPTSLNGDEPRFLSDEDGRFVVFSW